MRLVRPMAVPCGEYFEQRPRIRPDPVDRVAIAHRYHQVRSLSPAAHECLLSATNLAMVAQEM
jgi:hypothetical protein